MKQQEQVLVTPFFKTIAVQDMNRSRSEGRPCFNDVEFVEVRIAGDRNYAPCFPALSMWKRIDGEEVTYAERWSDQYQRFKEGQTQVANGTPLSEVPFLTESKRAELRALKIYTAEALAALEGRNLKTLGIDGNSLKQQAIAYIEKASGTADVTRMAEEMAALRQQIEELKAAGMKTIQPVVMMEDEPEPQMSTSRFSDWDDETLKEYLAEKTGARPRGNPGHETLVRMAEQFESAAA